MDLDVSTPLNRAPTLQWGSALKTGPWLACGDMLIG